jgi:hypothetical protein
LLLGQRISLSTRGNEFFKKTLPVFGNETGTIGFLSKKLLPNFIGSAARAGKVTLRVKSLLAAVKECSS